MYLHSLPSLEIWNPYPLPCYSLRCYTSQSSNHPFKLVVMTFVSQVCTLHVNKFLFVRFFLLIYLFQSNLQGPARETTRVRRNFFSSPIIRMSLPLKKKIIFWPNSSQSGRRTSQMFCFTCHRYHMLPRNLSIAHTIFPNKTHSSLQFIVCFSINSQILILLKWTT